MEDVLSSVGSGHSLEVFIKQLSNNWDTTNKNKSQDNSQESDEAKAQDLMISPYNNKKSIHHQPLQRSQSAAVIEKYLENGRFKNKFEKLSVLGRGGFGTVFKCRYLLDNNIYAIKKIKVHLGFNETLADHKVYREIQAITMLDPKHIIRYYICWIEALDEEEQLIENRVVEKYIEYNRMMMN